MPTQTYTPGVCNIGPSETSMRLRSGWISALVAVILLIILLTTHALPPLRLLLFLPLFGAAIGFFQAGLHFCAGYGLAGIYNVMNPLGSTQEVETASFRKADRSKAILILLYSLATAGLLTALCVTL